jgi:hypothetical protein
LTSGKFQGVQESAEQVMHARKVQRKTEQWCCWLCRQRIIF